MLTVARAVRAGDEPVGLLQRILRNVFINGFRQAQVRPRAVHEDWERNPAVVRRTAHVSAETTVIASIPDERLRVALSSLSAKYREVVLLSDVEGFSYKEIAGLGCRECRVVGGDDHRAGRV